MLKIGGQEIPTRTVALVVSEGLLVLLGLLAAMAIQADSWGSEWYSMTMASMARLGFALLICELSLYYSDVYDSDVYDLQLSRTRISIFIRLLQAFGFACLFLAAAYFVFPEMKLRHGAAIIAAPLILLVILGWRLLLQAIGILSQRSERMVVLGTGPVGVAAVREICSRPELNLRVIGFLDEDSRNVGKPLVNPGIVAVVDELEQIVNREKISRVMVALGEQRGSMFLPVLLRLKLAGVAIEDAGAVLERITGRICIGRSSDPSWLLFSDGFHKSTFMLSAKRAADILVALGLLLITLPFMAVVAVAIMATEFGAPVLFHQKRVGLNGKVFEILKFRSMCQDAEACGPRWAADGDRRITRVGQVIRKWRLDELPQLWNVLRGDMSLVGPRPEQPYFCELLEQEVSFFAQRYSVRPGITGWAQIKYGYGASVADAIRKLEFDLFYLKHLSLQLDIAIILATIKVVLLARGSK